MLKYLIVTTLVLCGAPSSLVLADAKQDITSAAQKLIDSDNYSWTTATDGAAGMGGGGASGKTQKDGLTELHLMFRDTEAVVFLQGDKAVYRTPDGEWQTLASAGRDGGEPGPGRFIGGMVRNYQPPANQALNLASKAQDLKPTDDGGFTGTLSGDDAKGLIQRRAGRRQRDGAGAGPGAGAGAAPPEVKDPAATVTFWIKDGVLTKYQFNVTGTMSTPSGEERQINRTNTVEITDIGTTTINVPEEAKAKME